MEAKAATATSGKTLFPRGMIGDLDSAVAQQVLAAGGDVAMVIDRDGVIVDMALSPRSTNCCATRWAAARCAGAS